MSVIKDKYNTEGQVNASRMVMHDWWIQDLDKKWEINTVILMKMLDALKAAGIEVDFSDLPPSSAPRAFNVQQVAGEAEQARRDDERADAY